MIKPDIVEYIRQYLPLRKKGKSYWACCPFHGETQSSFTVSEEKQMFYCFGCHEGGDVIAFIEKYHSTDFAGALNIIGHKKPETKRERRKLCREIQLKKREQKRQEKEEQQRHDQDRLNFIRLADLDYLITLTKDVMAGCSNMVEIEEISDAINRLPIWEYERDCLLYE